MNDKELHSKKGIQKVKIKKIPYGDSDYGEIVNQNKLYVDKTRFIHELEYLPDYIFLIRPRRFGKSLWINLLQYYYDFNRKDQFDTLFKDTFIGKNPTSNKNRMAHTQLKKIILVYKG